MNLVSIETPALKEVKIRKQEIEEKLLEDKRKRNIIKENLDRADIITSQMVSTLDTFDDRLRKLEDTILPVHRQTKDLQRLQDNIEKTLSSLDHVISFHHVAREVKPIIQKPVGGDVSKYIDCMKKLQDAIKFFSDNSPGSLELNTVTSLYDRGNDMLATEFKTCLSRHCRDLSAESLMELISVDKNEVPLFLTDKAIKNLSVLAKWLTSVNKSEDYINNYSNLRCRNLLNSIETVRNFCKISPSNNKKLPASLTTPKRGTSKVATLRKMSGMLRKDSASPGTSSPNQGKNLTVINEENVDLEVQPFISMCSVFLKLLFSEHKMLQEIIPSNFHQSVFIETVNIPMGVIEISFRKFVQYAKQCIESRDHPSIINIFPVINYLQEDVDDFQHILRGTDESNKTRMLVLMTELCSAGRNVLEEFIDTVKSDPEKESNMPKDGTVHELTSNTMMFVHQLAINPDVADRVLSGTSHQNRSNVLARYLSNVLAALKLNLENKSRIYMDTSLRAIFLMNNYHFISTALLRKNKLELISQVIPNIDKIYKNHIIEEKRTFLASWQKVVLLISSEGFSIQRGSKLKDKDRQIVKDKLKVFNNEFEELIKVQQRWAIPNNEIKLNVKQTIKDLLLQPFTDMYNKCRLIEFTKNIDKYLRYTPETVASEVDKLFSQVSS